MREIVEHVRMKLTALEWIDKAEADSVTAQMFEFRTRRERSLLAR